MSKPRANPAKRLKLEEFLAQLPPEEAGQLRAISERMDELERHAAPVRGIERQLAIPLLVAIIMFGTGLFIVLSGGWIFENTLQIFSEIGLCVLLGALPGLGAYYAYRVKGRTGADMKAFQLNREHFLPLNVLYFPASEDNERAWIVPVDKTAAYTPKPSKYDQLKAGRIW